MALATSKALDEAQIRTLIDDRVAAVRAKDVNGLMSNVASDALLFDALPPLQRSGSAAIRAKTEEWVGWYQGPIGFEIRDLSITAGDDVAFCHYLYRVSGTMKDGQRVDMWLRTTVCFRKIDGKWMVTHEHTSVPFEAESGKASVGLQP